MVDQVLHVVLYVKCPEEKNDRQQPGGNHLYRQKKEGQHLVHEHTPSQRLYIIQKRMKRRRVHIRLTRNCKLTKVTNYAGAKRSWVAVQPDLGIGSSDWIATGVC